MAEEQRTAKLLADLASADSFVRVQAARRLAQLALPDLRPALQKALSQEHDPWVRRALTNAIAAAGEAFSRTSERSAPEVEAVSAPEDLLAEARASATETMARYVVHEVEPVLGRALHHARQEIENAEASRTVAELEDMKRILLAVADLGNAASAPSAQEFDLSSLLIRVADKELDSRDGLLIHIEFGGPGSLFVHGDETKVGLAIRNALRNAIEASTTSTEAASDILISWGETERDVWASVADRGPGLDTSGIPVVGHSSKEGHLGIGLAVSRSAAEALGGNITLTNRDGGGARFELRWPGRIVAA